MNSVSVRVLCAPEDELELGIQDIDLDFELGVSALLLNTRCQRVYCLSRHGSLFMLDMQSLHRQAALSGSSPITAITQESMGRIVYCLLWKIRRYMSASSWKERTMNAGKEFNEAKRLVEQKKFLSAKSRFEKGLADYSMVDTHLAFTYQLAVLYVSEIGNGEAARRLFQEVVNLFESHSNLRQDRVLLRIKANACENLMLLSLSHEEYEKWADELEELQPENEILKTHKPLVQRRIDEGYAWSLIMFATAQQYLSPDPSEHHSYPYGASILQLLLNRRKAFRLPRSDWRDIVLSYGTAVMGIVGDCGQKIEQISKEPYPEEFAFVVADAIPLVEEYANKYSSDEQCQELLNSLIISAEQLNLLSQKESTPERQAPKKITPNENSGFWYLLFAFLGALLGPRLLPQLPSIGAVLIGFLGGLLIGFVFARINWTFPPAISAKPPASYKVSMKVKTGDQAEDDLYLGNQMYMQGEFEEALPLFESALAKSRRKRDLRLQGVVHSRLAMLLADLGQVDEAFQHAEQALPLVRKYEEREAEIETLQILGALYMGSKKNMSEGLKHYDDSLKLARSVTARKDSTIELKALELNGITNLASLHLRKNENQEASRLIKQGRSLAKDVEAFWRNASRAASKARKTGLGEAVLQNADLVAEMSGQAGVMARRAGMYHVIACDVLERMGDILGAKREAELALEIGEEDQDTFLIDRAKERLRKLG